MRTKLKARDGHIDRVTGAVAARGEIQGANAIATLGFTERQARFLVAVMPHSGVFVGRQYAAFAGITHGQKVHDFLEGLVARKFVAPIELGLTGRTRIFHVHHKPLYTAIGEPDNRNRRRVTIDRAIERLMVWRRRKNRGRELGQSEGWLANRSALND